VANREFCKTIELLQVDEAGLITRHQQGRIPLRYSRDRHGQWDPGFRQRVAPQKQHFTAIARRYQTAKRCWWAYYPAGWLSRESEKAQKR